MAGLYRRLRPQGLRVTPPRLLAVALLLVLGTNLGLLFDLSVYARATVVALHIGLGLLIVPVGFYALYVAYKARRRAFPVGHLLVIATGVTLIVVGGKDKFALVLAAHAAVAAGFATVALLPRRVAFLGAPFLALVVGFYAKERLLLRPAPEESAPPRGDADPLENGSFLDVTAVSVDDAPRFLDVTRCQSCHAKAVRDHQNSPHFHASVTNPYYLTMVRKLDAERGEKAAQVCTGCHDVGLAVSRAFRRGLDEGPAISAAFPGAEAGVPCLLCHGATTVRTARGNGSFALAMPDDPLVTDDGAALFFAQMFTRIDPRLHRAAMMPTDARSSFRCGTCHEARLHEAVNDVIHTRGQIDRETFLSSGFAEGSGPSSILSPKRKESCVSCHMTRTSSGHLVAAAHTALPAARSDAKTLAKVVAALEKSMPLTLSWLAVSGGDDEGTRVEVRPSTGVIEGAPGDLVAMDLLVTNERVGHGFPGGTADFSRITVETTVIDGHGHVILDEGTQPDDDVSPNAHSLTKSVVDKAGHDVVDHDTTRLFTPLFDHTIAPGRGEIIRYRFRLPNDAVPPFTIVAEVKMKKARTEATVRSEVHGLPVPTVVVARSDNPATALPAGTRLARYADAAGAAWDDVHAEAALRVAETQVPADLEVKLAWARFLLDRKHHRADAVAVLADERDPRALFLLARAHLDGGAPELARPILETLLDKAPRDVGVLFETAVARRRTGEPGLALQLVDRALLLRPDDFPTLQLGLALAGELRASDRVAGFRDEIARTRFDRDGTAAANARAATDPVAAREADRAHVHALQPRPKAP